MFNGICRKSRNIASNLRLLITCKIKAQIDRWRMVEIQASMITKFTRQKGTGRVVATPEVRHVMLCTSRSCSLRKTESTMETVVRAMMSLLISISPLIVTLFSIGTSRVPSQNFSRWDLRFYDANVVGRERQFSEALKMMKEQFNSASKQQQVKEELAKLSYVAFLGKTCGNKRKSFKEQKNRIEKRIPLCPGTWRHETRKIEILHDVLGTEYWTENKLSRVGASKSWRGLCTELGNALQIRIEREGELRETEGTATDLASKSPDFFTAPRHTKRSVGLCFPDQN